MKENQVIETSIVINKINENGVMINQKWIFHSERQVKKNG